jgi:phosphomevalonate kinase
MKRKINVIVIFRKETEILYWRCNENSLTINRSKDHKTNEYTEKTILFTLLTISGLISKESFESLLSKGLSITILGDNDFYSQRDQLEHRNLPITSASLATLPKFLPTVEGSLETMKKTGLGSSAALVTSLTTALLGYFNAVPIPSKGSSAPVSQVC